MVSRQEIREALKLSAVIGLGLVAALVLGLVGAVASTLIFGVFWMLRLEGWLLPILGVVTPMVLVYRFGGPSEDPRP